MWDWVITYWVQVLFGLMAAGFGLLAKKFWKMYQNEKERDKQSDMNKCYEKVQAEISEIKKEVDNIVIEKEDLFDREITKVHQESLKHDKKIEEELKSLSNYIETLKDGVLSIQASHFRLQCKRYLQDDRFISIDEFEQLTYDHNIYNKLGGNHLGDSLFEAVEAKFRAQQTLIESGVQK